MDHSPGLRPVAWLCSSDAPKGAAFSSAALRISFREPNSLIDAHNEVGMAISSYAIIKDLIIPCIAVLSGVIGGVITIHIYYRNSKLRRAEWLDSLFEKFSINPNMEKSGSCVTMTVKIT
jgi:hypothetical protein